MAEQTNVVDPAAPPVIQAIQRKADGTFLIELGGYPFHATEDGTPEVFARVKAMIEDGESFTEYAEPQPPEEDLALAERVWRDGEIERVKWLRERHRDELERGRPLTLSDEQFEQLLDYIQALRDWPQSDLFPAIEHRPTPPDWLIA